MGQNRTQRDADDVQEQALNGASTRLQQAGTTCQGRQSAKTLLETQPVISFCATQSGCQHQRLTAPPASAGEQPQRYGGPDGLGPGPNVPNGGSSEQRYGIVHVGSFWKSGMGPFSRSKSCTVQISSGKTVPQGFRNCESSVHAPIPNWNVIVPLNKSKVAARARPKKPRVVLFISKLP